MKLRYENGDNTGKELDIPSRGLSIGRYSGCDLQIDEDGISRKHCFIKKVRDNYVLEDLGSTNGVKLNGEKIDHKASLEENDVFQVGPYRFKLVAEKSEVKETETNDSEEEKPSESGVKKVLNMALTGILLLVFLGLIYFLIYYFKNRPEILG